MEGRARLWRALCRLVCVWRRVFGLPWLSLVPSRWFLACHRIVSNYPSLSPLSPSLFPSRSLFPLSPSLPPLLPPPSQALMAVGGAAVVPKYKSAITVVLQVCVGACVTVCV